jgi:hypothetical protein
VKRHALVASGALVALVALWPVTGAIQRRLGLDSVWALFINGGLFVAAGLVLGAMSGKR